MQTAKTVLNDVRLNIPSHSFQLKCLTSLCNLRLDPFWARSFWFDCLNEALFTKLNVEREAQLIQTWLARNLN